MRLLERAQNSSIGVDQRQKVNSASGSWYFIQDDENLLYFRIPPSFTLSSVPQS
jgi:hypothetical protein